MTVYAGMDESEPPQPVYLTQTYEHDAVGRLTKVTYPTGHFTEMSYDDNGNRETVTPPGRPAHVFEYTDMNERYKYTPPQVGASADTVTYGYDGLRRLSSISLPGGELITFNPDARTTTIPTGSIVTTLKLDTELPETVSGPNGVVVTHSYQDLALTSTAWSGTPVVGTVGYTWDTAERCPSAGEQGRRTVAARRS
jgi:YD repeat-containing protein